MMKKILPVILLLILPLTAFAAKTFQVDTGGTLTTGLVSYYPLEEASGLTRVDFFGSNNLTDWNTVGAGTGIIGTSTDFGTSNSTKFASSSSNYGITAGSISMAGWFKSQTGNPNPNTMWGHGSVAPNDIQELVRAAGTTAVQFRREGATNDFASDSVNVEDGAWHFIAFRYNGNNIVGNIDNRAAVSASSTQTGGYGTFDNRTNGFLLGRQVFASAQYTSGFIDEIGVWNKYLSNQEITDLYNAGVGQTMVNTVAAGPPQTTVMFTGNALFVGNASFQ